MADAMVVARMTQEKKDAVAKKLAEMGTTASAAVNLLYDYIERYSCLPEGLLEQEEAPRDVRAAAALAWLSSLPVLEEGNRFQFATDDDIRRERLAARGLAW